MTNTTITTEDAIRGATSVARDIADGKLSPADLEAAAVAELTELFGEVVPGGACWELQRQVARGVLAAGGIAADELAEWAAVQRASEAASILGPDPAGPEPISVPSASLSPEEASPDPDTAEAGQEPAIPATRETPVAQLPQRQPGEYDPLANWAPGKTKRNR